MRRQKSSRTEFEFYSCLLWLATMSFVVLAGMRHPAETLSPVGTAIVIGTPRSD